MALANPGQPLRSRIMRERWAAGQIATNAYRERLAELVKPGMRILHAGCGWDKNDVSRRFKDTTTVVGVDLDPRVRTLFHSEFHLASVEALPFPDESFDLIFSEYVFEHLTDPELVLKELRRVLKSSGTILVLTPNLFSYKTVAARITPQWFHILMGRHRYGKGHEDDMYPTVFRCNTERQFRASAARARLVVHTVSFITNGPTWFAKIPGLFETFDAFHRGIARWEFARRLRCALLVELRRERKAM